MKEAEDKGALDQVKAAVQAMSTAPVDFLSNALGTAAPAILASLGATVLGPAAAIGAGLTVGSTMGAGTVKGSIYDAVKEELSKTMPPDQAEARALLAQEYGGKNLDMILTGAAIGSIGATTGAEPAIARQIAKGILTKSAVKKELGNVAEEGLKKAAERGAIKQGAISGGTEFGTEFAQAGQEQLAQNIAAQREGVDVPTMRGVVGQAALEGLAGLGLGSVAGGREALVAREELDNRKLREDKKAKKDAALVADTTTEETITPPDVEKETKLKRKFDDAGNPIAVEGGQDVIQPIDTGASGDGAEVLGGPRGDVPADGTTEAGLGRPGVDGDQGLESAPQDGTAAQQSALSAEEQAAINEEAAAELSGEAKPIVAKQTAQTQAKQTKATATPAATPIAQTQAQQSYLEKPSYYGAEKPKNIDQAINYAGHEEAFDAFDTVDIKDGVMPELKTIAEERNKEQQVKRQQMRQELSGKVDPETGKKYTPKRITSLVSNIPLFKPGTPLDFLSEEQLVDIYKKHADKRGFLKEEATTRQAEQQLRSGFLNELEPLQQSKVQTVAQRSFADEVVSNARRKAQTTEADKRKNREKKQTDQLFFDVQQQVDEAKADVAEREKTAQDAAVKESIEEEELATTAKEVSAAADKVLPKKQAPKEKPVPVKSKLVVAIENAIRAGNITELLKVVGDRKLNDRMTGVIGSSFQKLLADYDIKTKIKFGKVEDGKDGKFDPKTNTITIKGSAKEGYTGERPLAQAVIHETSHATLDHVFDNRDAFIKSLPGEKRDAARAALNRLDNNHKLAVTKFGSKYNIKDIKEFAAEFFENPKFQEDLAMMSSPTPYAPKENFFTTIVKNIATALGISNKNEGVEFKEIAEDLAQLISIPTKDIKGAGVSFAGSKKAEAEPPNLRRGTYNSPGAAYKTKEIQEAKNVKWFKKTFTTREGWKGVATKFQNDRFPIKNWEDVFELSGKIIHATSEKFNDVYTRIVQATSDAVNYYREYVATPMDMLDASIGDYAKASKLSVNEVTERLHILMEALHEPERRLVKYMLTVPLNKQAADRRAEILKDLRSNIDWTLKEQQDFRKELDSIVFEKDAKGKFVLTADGYRKPNMKNVDAIQTDKKIEVEGVDYNVLGIDLNDAAITRKEYESDPHKDLMDDILGQIKELNDVTVDLNKISNYWSQPVTNLVGFYGFERYAPFQGYPAASEVDEMIDLDSGKNGKEHQEAAVSMDGRFSVSENPLLQVMANATRAAARAGRRHVTESIKNAIAKDANGKQLLAGKLEANIPFNSPTRDEDIKQYKGGENYIFHYNKDGSIDVISITDPKQRNAIRRTYEDSSTMVDIANRVTSTLGQMHTRYNYNFAPMNFVRDALTNAWTMGAEMGPVASARLIKEVTSQVALKGSLFKAMKVANMLQKNKIAELNKLAATDATIKNMVEYILEGKGMVSYLDSVTSKANFERLQKKLGRKKIVKVKEDLDVLVDTWTDMFEIASRSAAYGVVKKQFMKDGLSEEAAIVKAGGYVKNLANFEQVGELGKAMGAFYMFFRPSATGAVRAIEATAPAFDRRTNEQIKNSLPEAIRNDPEALKTYLENYSKKKTNARIMVSALMGMGALAYTMSAMMAPDDDLGRNKLMTDNMDQWTRFWRLHIPGFETPLQVPWGFGLGAFAAAGAQLASIMSGQQSVTSALANMFLSISLDSFVPIPVSRMKPTEDPLAFAVDSVAPSSVRPIIEFLINKNGIGQDIYNDASGRRMGDAFLGGDKIPEMYKTAAKDWWDLTNGGIDVSPNTLYFLSNSYLDGVGRIFEGAFGITDSISGRKQFSAKTDLPLFGSFFGAESNVDSRQFTDVEKQIKQKASNIQSSLLEPNRYVKYKLANPFDEALVEAYNKDVVELNDMREAAKKIRLDRNLTPKEQQEILKIYTFQQNIIKRNLIERYKAYGVEPS